MESQSPTVTSGAVRGALSVSGRGMCLDRTATRTSTTSTSIRPIAAQTCVDSAAARPADLTGDGDVNDTVLEVLDSASGIRTTLCVTDAVTVDGGTAAFLRPESAGPASAMSDSKEERRDRKGGRAVT